MNDELSAGRASAPPGWIPPAPPPPGSSVAGADGERRSHRALTAAAVALALIAGGAIGFPLGRLTLGSHPTPAPPRSSGSASTSAATARARALYSQALAAMRASPGFHYVADSTGAGTTQTIVGDAGQSGGRQDITVVAPAGRERFTLLLVSGTVYFQGNVPALEDQLGMPAVSAPTLQDKWVSVSSQDGPYGVVAPGIVVADQVQETALDPASTAPVRTAGGRSATRIVGTVPPQQGAPPGTGHLDVAGGAHLPVSYVTTASSGGVDISNTTTFSGWGTAPTMTAPTGAVAWSTLGASAPPGGYGSGGGSLTPSPTPQL